VNQDCLKLTVYFGERQRVDGRFYADKLLDLFGEYEVATSILLRGIGGFGLRHHLRSDQFLSMSEDPSVIAVAVDRRECIDALLARLLQVKRRGLLTLERARLLSDDLSDVDLPGTFESTKLTIYLGRQQRVYRVPAYRAVCELLHRRGIAGATVLLGVDGTIRRDRRRARFFESNSDVPTMAIAVGSADRIAAVLPELGALLVRPLVTVERVRVCKRDGQLLERPHALPGRDEHGLGLWQKTTVHTSESTLYQGEPIHRALIRRLRESTSARGATAVRGVWGFHGDHAPHGDRFLQLGRRVPVVTTIVDTPDGIARSFEIVDELTREHGLVTTEMVPALLSVTEGAERGGLRLADHDY
jgi:PII-like signaling protein